jgi:hypothetical protein
MREERTLITLPNLCVECSPPKQHNATPPPDKKNQVMGKAKALVKVHPEGKYVVDVDKAIDIGKLAPGARVALRSDSYALHILLPTKVDPLVSLMKVEKVPDSTYDMIGGLDQQIKEIKEVCVSLVAVGGWGVDSGAWWCVSWWRVLSFFFKRTHARPTNHCLCVRRATLTNNKQQQKGDRAALEAPGAV